VLIVLVKGLASVLSTYQVAHSAYNSVASTGLHIHGAHAHTQTHQAAYRRLYILFVIPCYVHAAAELFMCICVCLSVCMCTMYVETSRGH